MEGRTSTSNEGSKKRNLDDYKEASVKKVSNKEIDKAFDLKGFSALKQMNFVVWDAKTNLKGLNSENPVSSSSADVLPIDLEGILDNGVKVGRVHIVTDELAPLVEKKRSKAKKEKEARETEEAMQEIKEKEMEDNEIK